MAMKFTQPLTEMSTSNFLGGKARPAHKADLTATRKHIFYKMWEHQRFTTLWSSMAFYKDRFTGLYLGQKESLICRKKLIKYTKSTGFIKAALKPKLYKSTLEYVRAKS
jgi:hypothetical protein